jgi:hypothetical protein
MKKINIKSCLLLSAILVVSVVFITSCVKDKDAEDPVIPKTMEEYKSGLLAFVSSEKALLDTCIIGYNKYDFKVASTASFTPYKTAYKLVLDTAYARLNRSGITIADIVAIDKTLSIPGKAFWGALFLSDRRPLNDSIVSSEALNAATIVGTGPGQVLQDPKTTFTAAITTAKSTRDATVTIERQIPPAITKLEDAENVFRAAIIPATIGEYQAKAKTYVSTEKTFVETCSVGYNKDDYNVTQQTAYLAALVAADPIVNDAAATYTTISAALNTLSTPNKAFYASKFVCDRRPLNDSIVVAQALNTATIVGTSPGQVPAAAKTTYTTAITTAVTARDKATTNEGQVKSAIYNLGLATKNFKTAIIK